MTEITQADRDAAVEWYSPRESEWTGLLAQAFARHREYGYHQGYYDGRTMTEAETVANIVAWLRKDAIRAWGADCTGRDETTFITDAIEAGEWDK